MLPVTDMLPVIIKEPVIVWFALKILDPVVANTKEPVPFNKIAYDADMLLEA